MYKAMQLAGKENSLLKAAAPQGSTTRLDLRPDTKWGKHSRVLAVVSLCMAHLLHGTLAAAWKERG